MRFENELNEKQYEAVSSESQNLRIIAGAGSGKTRVLTYRIAYLIEEMNLRPYEILAITFTNKVAKEMKERTVKLVPYVKADDLKIFTFHSWCARFLRSEIRELGFPSSFLIIDETDQLSLLKNIAADFGYKKSDDIVKFSLSKIGAWKTEGLLPDDVDKATLLSDMEVKAHGFFVEYEKRKNSCFYLDFDDLLIYAVKILEENINTRAKYSYRYKSILVDEFQDTNDLQYKLLRLLSNSETMIYVVGDPDQTIYTWRGANQDIILNLNRDFEDVETVVLAENYRSTTSILDAANNLISHNLKRYKKDLFTNNEAGKKVEVKAYHDGVLEGKGVVKEIKNLVNPKQNINYKDIAVLYRSSYLSLKIENELTAQGIPYKIYGGIKFYSRKEVKDCLAYFRLLLTDDDDVSFERIVNVPRRGIGEATIDRLRSEANEHNLHMIGYIRDIHNYQTQIRGNFISKLNSLLLKIDTIRNQMVKDSSDIPVLLQNFLEDIGYYSFIAEQDKDNEDDRFDNVKALLDDVTTYLKNNEGATLDDYLQNVSLISSQDEIADSNVVSLMTVHTAKGLEFPYVFLIGFANGVFPNQRAVLERNGMEEERRLAYVAFTRAMKGLYISYNTDYSYVTQSSATPSEFLNEAKLDIVSNNSQTGYRAFNDRYKGHNTYRFDDGNRISPFSEFNSRNTTKENVISIKPNGITWNVGDKCKHTLFGEGTILKVEDIIVEVDFVSFGIKKIMKNHPTLSKIGDGKEENIDDARRS